MMLIPFDKNKHQKRGCYAPQRYQVSHTKTTKKTVSKRDKIGKKQKGDIVKKVLAEAVAEYDFTQVIETLKEDLLGIEKLNPTGIIKLDEMARYIDMVNNNKIIKFSTYKRSSIYLKDEELAIVDRLIDDRKFTVFCPTMVTDHLCGSLSC